MFVFNILDIFKKILQLIYLFLLIFLTWFLENLKSHIWLIVVASIVSLLDVLF